jgi:molecular chaperone Hsp33
MTTTTLAGADLLRPFHLERSQLRGRAIRLGDTVDYVLRAHAYPRPVSELLGEALVLAGAMAGGLKFDGRFSLQVRGDGPVRLLVVDCTNDGRMRGYAGFDAGRVGGGAPGEAGGEAGEAAGLLGQGLLALTIDQREAGGEAYQGIVELGGDTLADCMRAYFEQSEQVPTAIRIAVDRDPMTGRWQAGAIVVQAMPGSRPGDGAEADDHWRRVGLHLATATDAELLDPSLPLDDLLFRLFHEDGVRVFDPQRLSPGCGCDEGRVVAILESFTPEELQEMRLEDGSIAITCQFCSRAYRLEAGRVAAMLAAKAH